MVFWDASFHPELNRNHWFLILSFPALSRRRMNIGCATKPQRKTRRFCRRLTLFRTSLVLLAMISVQLLFRASVLILI